tara:strand:- start:318 stop:1496 length:1179 start_codon:yes stop_codon:yes gene_type:complete
MSWTSKVANVIKGQIANHIGSKLMSSFASGGSTSKLAAKLASKSRLDIDKSPTSHLSADNDPFQYGMVYYPEETANLGEGHYIMFDTIWNTRSLKFEGPPGRGGLTSKFGDVDSNFGLGVNEAQKRRKQGFKNQGLDQSIIRGTKTGLQRKGETQTHKHLGSSIILYTPASAKFDYKASYEQAETKNLAMLKDAGSNIIGNVQAFLDGPRTAGAAKSGMGDILGMLKETGSVIGRQVLQGALEVAFPGAAGFFTKQTGRALNPRMELAFQSVPFRNFQFEFDFAPKNQKEVESVNKIMQLFKFHMQPDVSNEKYLITPSEFQIMYYYRDKVNTYLPKISRCVLTDMSIDYAPEGVFHTFKADPQGAMPVISKLTLTFSETEIMTKQTISDGF